MLHSNAPHTSIHLGERRHDTAGKQNNHIQITQKSQLEPWAVAKIVKATYSTAIRSGDKQNHHIGNLQLSSWSVQLSH